MSRLVRKPVIVPGRKPPTAAARMVPALSRYRDEPIREARKEPSTLIRMLTAENRSVCRKLPRGLPLSEDMVIDNLLYSNKASLDLKSDSLI